MQFDMQFNMAEKGLAVVWIFGCFSRCGDVVTSPTQLAYLARISPTPLLSSSRSSSKPPQLSLSRNLKRPPPHPRGLVLPHSFPHAPSLKAFFPLTLPPVGVRITQKAHDHPTGRLRSLHKLLPEPFVLAVSLELPLLLSPALPPGNTHHVSIALQVHQLGPFQR
jgi:hypothetical protein